MFYNIVFIVVTGILLSKSVILFSDDFENGASRWYTSNGQTPFLVNYDTVIDGKYVISLALNSCSPENVFSLPNFKCSSADKCIMSFDALGSPLQLFSTVEETIVSTVTSDNKLTNIHYNLVPNYNDWTHVEYFYPETIASEFEKKIVFRPGPNSENNTCLISYVDNVNLSKKSDTSSLESEPLLIIVFITVAVLLAIVLAGFMIQRFLRRNVVGQYNNGIMFNPSVPIEDRLNTNYQAKYAEGAWQHGVTKLNFSEMKKGEILGEGNSATVSAYKWHAITVAVKSLKIEDYPEGSLYDAPDTFPETKSDEKNFVEKKKEERKKIIHDLKWEMFIITSIGEHEHIVNLIGYVNNPSSVVLSHMPARSVHDYMVVNYICPEDKIKIAKGVAAALLHLHYQRVIHRDVALRNVLLGAIVTSNNRISEVVLSDFELSLYLKPGETSSTASNNYGPVAWMSPESLKKTYSPQTDRFMFSMLLWELFQEDTPWSTHQTNHFREERPEVALASLARKILAGKLPKIDPSWQSFPKFLKIIEQGWSFNPSDRDSMETVHSKLKQLQECDVPPTPKDRLIAVKAGYGAIDNL